MGFHYGLEGRDVDGWRREPSRLIRLFDHFPARPAVRANDGRCGRAGRAEAERLLYWIEEREKIRRTRAAGQCPPWTADKILREYRFTDVRREDDKVTRWILDRWIYPFADDPDLWFGAVIARFVNWPDTLDELGFPVPWDPQHFLDVMAARERRGAKRYGGAYMIHADNTGLARPRFTRCRKFSGRCGKHEKGCARKKAGRSPATTLGFSHSRI
jgi:alpha-glutamyl/putrescinyl thymine pyrophosphorylase clade 1